MIWEHKYKVGGVALLKFSFLSLSNSHSLFLSHIGIKLIISKCESKILTPFLFHIPCPNPFNCLSLSWSTIVPKIHQHHLMNFCIHNPSNSKLSTKLIIRLISTQKPSPTSINAPFISLNKLVVPINNLTHLETSFFLAFKPQTS